MNDEDETSGGAAGQPNVPDTALPRDAAGSEARTDDAPATGLDGKVENDGDPNSNRSAIVRKPGMWSRQTISVRAAADKIITNESGMTAFQEDRLDPAGYRLAMGAEVYVSPAKAKDKTSVRSLEPREAFFIPAGQFAFLLTEELVKVPPDAFAFIALRTRTKFKGLVNVSGFHADPGYHGRLVFAVFNAGPGDVHLRRGDDLFIISFATLDEETEKPRSDSERFLHIPSDIITPIAGEVQSLAGLKEGIDEVRDDLSDRLHSMERDVAILRWAVALVLSAFVTLLVRFVTTK